METTHAGNRAESAVLTALVAMGFDVLVAFGNGHPYDLVAHAGPDFFMRVECKTARPVGACVSFFARDYIAKNWSIDRFEAEIAGRAAVGERAALA